MFGEVTVITPPTGTVVSVDVAKRQCRVTHTDEDDLFESYIGAAESRCEDVTGRQLRTATLEQWLDQWPCDGIIRVQRPNLLAVESVKYLDTAGVEQTIDSADYVVTAPAGPRAGFGRISLASGKSWPTVLDQAKAIRVRYTAGYGASVSSVPRSIVQGILLTIGTWYAQREDATVAQVRSVPLAASQLWRPFYVRG